MMHRGWLAPAIRVALCCASLATPLFAADEERSAPNEAVVPPGQEEVMAAMFGRGAMLPAGCAFAGGQADGAVIRAAYACPSGAVVFALVHPSTGAASAIQT